MSTADQPEFEHKSAPTAPSDDEEITARLASSEFVRFVTMPNGDAVAATAILARTLNLPFQARITRAPVDTTTDGLTVSVGRSGGEITLMDDEHPVAVRAINIARTLSDDVDRDVAVLALAGAVASERDPNAYADRFLDEIDRQPGVGIPIADRVDGLAHTTLVHAPFSGDPEATRAAFAAVDDDGRATASMLALSVVGDGNTRAPTAIERALNPYTLCGEAMNPAAFQTIAGYADVLDTLARSRPGTGLALSLGHDCYESALDGWREHATAVHTAVRDADLVRHHGLIVASLQESVDQGTAETVARLVRDFRSPEPVVLAIGHDAVAGTAVGNRDLSALFSQAMQAIGEADATEIGHGQCLSARIERTDAFVSAFREVID